MKTLVCLITILAITAPVLATEVWIVGDTSVAGELTLQYYVVGGDLRGIALTLDTGGTATADASDAGTVPGANWNVCLDHAYDVVTAAGTYNLGDGGPMAKIDGPGEPVGPVEEFSICIGFVDDQGGQAGVPVGSQGTPEDLCTIVLSANNYAVTVNADMLRGGAVGSPVDIIFDANNDGTPGDNDFVTDVCFAPGNQQESDAWDKWVSENPGPPLNWCGDCWRVGDINADCVITWSGDVQPVYDDLLTIAAAADPLIVPQPTAYQLEKAASGRSDLNMDGSITFADLSNGFGTGVYDILLAQNATVPPVSPCVAGTCTSHTAEWWPWIAGPDPPG